LDNDGDNDILAASAYNKNGYVPSIYWYENDGNNQPDFTEHLFNSDIGIDQVCQMISSDFDGDGDMDLLIRSDEPWRVSWLENLASEPLSFRSHSLPIQNGYYPSGMTIHDFNGDDLADVVISYTNQLEFGAGEVIMFENHLTDQSPHWLPIVIDQSIISPDKLEVADLDNDGDMDLFVLACFQNEDKIYYIEQLDQSTYTFATVLFEEIYRPRYIRIDDIDQDGDQDVLLQGLSDLYIYENIDIDPIRLIYPRGRENFDDEAELSIEWKTDVLIAGTEIEIELLKGHQNVYHLGYDSDPDGRNTKEISLPPLQADTDYTIQITSTMDPNFSDESELFQVGYIHRH